MLDRANMMEAVRRVERNRGCPGVDGMTWRQLRPYMEAHLDEIAEQLRNRAYRPSRVRRVMIDKYDGGKRPLGMPTVVDRTIQQALCQVLQPLFEPDFSGSSYGYRPHRSAHDALREAQRLVRARRLWVVDVDLERFFDTVDHDVLMARVARRVGDGSVLKAVRSFLEAGVEGEGEWRERSDAGIPQGGPLSPLLANIMLDDLDRELERRGHAFCRYADDVVIFVGSERASERVLGSVSAFVERRLKLKVNARKSGVRRPWECVYLGYTWTPAPELALRMSDRSVERLREKLDALRTDATRRGSDRPIDEATREILDGWGAYYALDEDAPRVVDELALEYGAAPRRESRAGGARGTEEGDAPGDEMLRDGYLYLPETRDPEERTTHTADDGAPYEGDNHASDHHPPQPRRERAAR
ncbi:group II intron reverse transcriptase/maturase [Candidatus Fermentibacterales bacterium]|nr:group II intron reverse transcriptase/maturase [Candidatus Fermentibacterales bacterium]